MASAMDGSEVLNLSRQHLKKVEPAQGIQHYSTLLLDHNELPRLENVETYSSLTKLSASHNQLVRMYGVARLYSLRILNLSHNNIVGIEGLKDMKHLTSLNLAGNNIKSIEHLNNNAQLEHLDLSDNAISSISDLSHMKCLRKLHLHANRIKSLQFCDKFIPASLCILTLADNQLTDLNEVSRLSHLLHLEQFTLMGNPCSASLDCNYRPFLLNWLMSLKILDEVLVNPKEYLVAEWLYSLGKGRQFKIGQHDELMSYLETVKPDEQISLNGKIEENKLDKILSLARQHQMTTDHTSQSVQLPAATASPAPQRRLANKKPTVASTLARNKQATPPKEAAKSSTSKTSSASKNPPYEDDLFSEPIPALMCQSLDPSNALMAIERSASATHVAAKVPRPVSTSGHPLIDEPSSETCEAESQSSSSLRRTFSAASNANRKPLYNRTSSHEPGTSSKSSSTAKSPKNPAISSKLPVQVPSGVKKGGLQVNSHSSSHSKLVTPTVSSEDRWKMNEVQAAVTIQKVWRGYQTRNLNPEVKDLKTRLRLNRTEDHVQNLNRQVAAAHDLCRLQEVRIQTLDDELRHEKHQVEQVKETCRQLESQVNELQETVQQILEWMACSSPQSAASGQPLTRPRTLPLAVKTVPESQATGQPVEDFARGMAHRLIQSSVSDKSDENTV